MKLLMILPSFPSPTWGGGTRNFYLLKALAHKHKVSLLALDNIEEVKTYCDTSVVENLVFNMQVINRPALGTKRLRQLIDLIFGRSYLLKVHKTPEMQKAIDKLLDRDHYDAVLFEGALIAGYRVPDSVKVILDQHNIEHELLRRTFQREKAYLRKGYNWLESRLVRPVEIERCRRSDAVVVTSERERLSLKSMSPSSVIEVVPNGVDVWAFRKSDSWQEVPGRIIFTGTFSHYPNIDAVLFFAQKCWPIIQAQVPFATWQIVGSNPTPEVRRLAELPGVTVTGTVPDVRPYLAAAEVAIVPLSIGSGTRLKILEALAMQKAVVSTNIGCEGLSVVSGKHLIVADEPEAFAQTVVTLLRDPEIRLTLGAAGRELVEAEYSWEQSGDKLLHVLEKLS